MGRPSRVADHRANQQLWPPPEQNEPDCEGSDYTASKKGAKVEA